MRRVPANLCTRCKGYKKLCGLPYCPIIDRFRRQVEVTHRLSGVEVEGDTPPSLVVGEHGFPSRVNVLFAVPPDVHGAKASEYDNPPLWAQKRLPLKRILDYRAGMLSLQLKVNPLDPMKLYEKEVSLAAVSVKPVETEAELGRKPLPLLRFDGILAPQSPIAPARELKVTGSPRVHPRLEKLVWDDASASDAVLELYASSVDVYTIIRAFSLGLLGRKRSRHLVPTRWAITAVDQIIANTLLRKVRTFDTIGEYEVYHASYLGNYFTIILAPGQYEAEMIEVWHPLTPWTAEAAKPVVYRIREYISLRQSSIDGGYMAARLPIVEHLAKRRRQAKVIIIREVTKDYYAPVGNWHIRETVKRAVSLKPIARCSTIDECLRHAIKIAKSDEAVRALKSSPIISKISTTKTLDEFLRK